MVKRETRAWDTQNIDLLLSLFHPSMAWPWPMVVTGRDPIDWVPGMGRFDEARWRKLYQDLFTNHTLVHNRREIKQIDVLPGGEVGFAVVDVDTLWHSKLTGKDLHWEGRTNKAYIRVGDQIKMTGQTSLPRY